MHASWPKRQASPHATSALRRHMENTAVADITFRGMCSNAVMELARGVRSQLEGLVAGLAGADLTPMSLGLSHSLSRYKLKFSPDKVRGHAALTGLGASLTSISMSVQMMSGHVSCQLHGASARQRGDHMQEVPRLLWSQNLVRNAVLTDVRRWTP
jgi:hypothetical protein